MQKAEEYNKNNTIAPLEPQAQDKDAKNAPAQEIAEQIKNHADAKKAVTFANYFGIGWFINSAASLYITYNVLPTKPAQAVIGKLKNGIHGFMSETIKLTNGGKKPSGIQLKYAGDKARSAAEILTMCISGTLLLFPMGLVARHEDWLAGRLDRWWNKKFYRDHPEALEASLEHEKKPEEDPISWAHMGVARVAGIATNLTVDQTIEAYNNHRHALGKSNFDTAEWRIGNIVYDQMSPKPREKLINFFSRHKAGIDSIQPTIQERLSHVVGSDPKRMVFAEQTRLFLKEFVLTLLLAGVVFRVCKAKIFPGEKENTSVAMATPMLPSPDLIDGEEEKPEPRQKQHASTISKSKASGADKPQDWKRHLQDKMTHFTDVATSIEGVERA